MDQKNWPLLAQFIIGLGIIGSILGVISGINHHDLVNLILGTAGILIFWNLYMFRLWALIGLNALLALKIGAVIVNLFKGLPLIVAIPSLIITGLIIYYFNSPKIKKLFA